MWLIYQTLQIRCYLNKYNASNKNMDSIMDKIQEVTFISSVLITEEKIVLM